MNPAYLRLVRHAATLSIACAVMLSLKAQVLSLNGRDWKIKDAPDARVPFCSDWLQATVPGNIQADLQNARILAPLAYGLGDSRLFDVARRDWWYRREFTVPTEFTGERIRLVFDGVDYACEVWLNGRKLGSNPNMHRRFEFEVAHLLKRDAANRLDVRLQRMPEELFPFLEKSDGQQSGAGTPWHIVPGMTKTIETLKDLKSATNFGYDWGVNIWTLGIWKDVRLEASGPALFSAVKIDTFLSDNYSHATVVAGLTIDSEKACPATVRVTISGHGSVQNTSQTLTLTKGSNVVRIELPLAKPALWWPNGQGEQNLYQLDAELLDSTGKVSHIHRVRFGIREVRWDLTSKAPADFPEKYMLVINGRKVRMIGSNLLPPDLLFARIRERAPHLLRMAARSGFNTLRVWGGGVIMTPDVYDLADELGLLLVLEMPIANIDPKADPELLANLDVTLPNILRQVWNHPSIIEYTGGNEMAYGKGGDATVIHHIRGIFAAVDPSRIFRDTDPTNGGAHGKWNFPLDLNNPNDPLGVYSTWNIDEPSKNGPFPYPPRRVPTQIYPIMRHGEFGYQTPAHLEVWLRDIPPVSQWPIVNDDPVLIRKNVTYAVFDNDNWLEKPVIDFLFGESPNLTTLLKAGQYVGAEGLRYAMDAIRRRGPATGGMMTWDYNEPWTNGAGSYLVDYDGRPLMNHAFAEQAAAPLSLSLRHATALYDIREGLRTSLFLTSDSPVAESALNWSWRVRDRRGTVVGSGHGTVDINPLEVKELAQIAVACPPRTAFGPFLVEVQLHDSRGQLLHERVHIFGLKGVRGSLRGLLDFNLMDEDDDPLKFQQLQQENPNGAMATVSRPVHRTTLQIQPAPVSVEGSEEVLEIACTNVGKMTALFCEAKPLLNYRTDQTTKNQYVSIPPGETRVLTIRAPHVAKDRLTLAQTGWRIESWNADTTILEPAPEVLLAVGRADQMCREFAGYPGLQPAVSKSLVRVDGRFPDPGEIPLRQDGSNTVEFGFPVALGIAVRAARLRIHSSDQAPIGALARIELNGQVFIRQIPCGYGYQMSDPARLAQAQTTVVDIPAGVLKPHGNVLAVQILDGGYFTWDALDLVSLNQ